MVALLNASYNLCIYTKDLRNLDNLLGMLWREIDLESVAHIEHLVHLCPISAALLMNSLEERWNREEVILDHATVVTDKVKDLGLCTT